ncbi:hypothetical protein MAR_003532 [Mya arenaria]|uniref:Uncharacterized protein n=1 Tax=Mya arenaria TaxID=6604 RepID=A0ABY7G9D0_MYAAR|nr:hypothetical protein MAR_003532 [Mya arenaria]
MEELSKNVPFGCKKSKPERPVVNKTAKHRTIRKLDNAFPFKRRVVPETHLKNVGPCTKDSVSQSLGKEVLKDIKGVIDKTKYKRSFTTLKSVYDVVASVSGEAIEKISGGTRIRTEVLKSKECSWQYAQSETRKDVINNNVKNITNDFWLRPGFR